MGFQGIRDGACVPSKGDSMLFHYPTMDLFVGVDDCSGTSSGTYTLGSLDVCSASPSDASNPLSFPFNELALTDTVSL